MAYTRDKYRKAREQGYRSGLEVAIARSLEERDAEFEYETVKIPFIQPEKRRSYTPDFILPNGIVLEVKGRMVTADRQKMLLIKQQYPALDIRFVFSSSRGRISKRSKTTYGTWAETKGFPYADKDIPDSWLQEPPNQESLKALAALQ